MVVEGKERINVYLNKEIKEKVRKEADKLGITITGFVNVCIMEYINQREAMDVLKIADKLNEIIAKTGGAPEQDAARG